MGKKGRKTRWRTLTITGEHSDSEESNTTTSGHREPKGYPPKNYYSRFSYSSQSTPTRRYQCDGTKSTRSSSTASENKITFNEDEYTRITTPRQDVLFKKGYLNKPKTYQTQTSTGNSTNSTGNSTGNGTPDHQSTDLEYESQFVFPNGFVDQNGIYYVNSFEPYPVMVYNPPTYYQEISSVKTKRCSTGSLTESTSPNNEETSQSETPSTVSELNPVYNVIYPGFYYDAPCQSQDVTCPPEPRRAKKRRRRKVSRSTSASSDEVSSDEEGEAKTDEETKKYDLKPDAEEFVPRAYRQIESIPMEVQFVKIPSNFVPLPMMGEFNAFIPPGIPINFVPHQNFINYVPYKTPDGAPTEEKQERIDEEKETVEVPKNQIDIAKIVSKLEEAAKEQDETGKSKEISKNQPKKRQKYQKVELRKPPPTPEPNKEWKKPTWKPPPSPKKEDICKPVKNYSDTLKKPAVQNEKKEEKNKIVVTKEVKNRKIEPTRNSNEWISVSSRKKRKNKNVEEEFDEEVQQVEETNDKIEEIGEKVEVEAVEEKSEVEVQVEVEVTIPPPPPPPEEKKVKKKPKNRNVKMTQSPVTKRVIIKDVDLSMQHEEPKVEVEEVKIEVEEVKIEPQPVVVVEEVKEEVEKKEEEVEKKESPEKKVKKKKKKVAKSVVLSQSSSNVTDDSYDFLLDETLEKTNVEVSQELDKMIQRGMYSSLEEKMKSLNIDPSDTFFKSIIHNISSRESSVEKNNFMKSPDLGKMIAAPALLQAKKSGDFLAEDTTLAAAGGGEPGPAADLYPITKAVKEWMTKTRETTPDVEILKSPSAIFREFSAPSVEEAEDVLEAMGVGEEEKPTLPKHGNLPYRAICCSIM